MTEGCMFYGLDPYGWCRTHQQYCGEIPWTMAVDNTTYAYDLYICPSCGWQKKVPIISQYMQDTICRCGGEGPRGITLMPMVLAYSWRAKGLIVLHSSWTQKLEVKK